MKARPPGNSLSAWIVESGKAITGWRPDRHLDGDPLAVRRSGSGGGMSRYKVDVERDAALMLESCFDCELRIPVSVKAIEMINT